LCVHRRVPSGVSPAPQLTPRRHFHPPHPVNNCTYHVARVAGAAPVVRRRRILCATQCPGGVYQGSILRPPASSPAVHVDTTLLFAPPPRHHHTPRAPAATQHTHGRLLHRPARVQIRHVGVGDTRHAARDNVRTTRTQAGGDTHALQLTAVTHTAQLRHHGATGGISAHRPSVWAPRPRTACAGGWQNTRRHRHRRVCA